VNVQEVLRRFPDARKSGSGWSARCPAHEDRNPSLSINEGDDGRVLLHCHCGCSPDAVVRAKGLSMSDLMPDRVERSRRHSRSSKKREFATPEEALAALERKLGIPTSAWKYLNANGLHVGTIVRWNRADGGKDIRPICLEDGMWRLAGMPSPRPLYCLPELPAADRVFITEGEKAADAARSLGLVATTSAHGSNAANKTDWTPLAGKEVVILPDNDAAGKGYAEDVVQCLSACEPRPAVRVVTLPGLPESGDIADLVAAVEPAGLEALRREVEAAVEAAAPVEYGSLVAVTGDERPTVWLESGEKPRATDQCLSVLARDHFHRGGQLVRCTSSAAGVRIVPVSQEAIDDTLNRRIRFARIKQDKDGNETEVVESAPAWLSKNIVSLQNWPAIRELEAVHHGPFLRNDGSVGGLRSGYDAESRCWVETAEDWSELNSPPTEQEARQAVETLFSLTKEFPFIDDADKSVWLAAILTRVARLAFQGPSPLFVITATTPGSGKTMLAKLGGIIADGRSPGMATLSRNDEENRKMITSALQEGAGVLVFDNVTGEIESPTMDRFLTSEVWTDRILGKTQMVTLPNLTVSILTANNAVIANDTARRSLAIRLAPLEERPENRDFTIPDLEGYVRANRRTLLIAVLRILQWHIANGRPQQEAGRFGSFESWSAVVRQPLLWIGLPDPLDTAESMQEADEGREACRLFLQAWKEWNHDWTGTARKMIEAIFNDASLDSSGVRVIREAACELVGDAGCLNGRPTPNALGNILRRMQRRNFAGLRIEPAGRAASGTRWKVVCVMPRSEK
jgi:hypothetical protein